MITTSDQAVLDTIEQQLEDIRKQNAETRAMLAEGEGYEARLETAYKALSGSKPTKGKAGRKQSKPCARKAAVMDVCLELVRQNAPLPQSDLEALVKDRLSESYNLSGVKLRMQECLSSDAFSVTADGMVSLVDDSQMAREKSA